MNTTILARVRRHFNSDLVSPAINRRNRLEWCRAARVVGDKWILRNGRARWGHKSAEAA